jgi:hypothetical protein
MIQVSLIFYIFIIILDKITNSIYIIGIQVKKLKKEHVKEQLESRGILKEMDINKKDLVKELEIELAKETLSKLSGRKYYF